MSRIVASAFLVLAACAPAPETSLPLAATVEDTPLAMPDPSEPAARYVVVNTSRYPDPDLAYVLAGHPPAKGDPVPSAVRRAFDRSGGVGGIPDQPATGTATGSSYVGTQQQIQVTGTQIPSAPGWYSLTLGNTGSGWVERMVVRLPDNPAPASTPVLVVFHKFGATEWDFYYNTTFLTEANARDWLLVAPYGASTKHFSCEPFQINTQAVLDFVFDFFPQADPDRVYGVGFSMGGGSMLNYAARHVDPARARFAALATHTGGGALWHTWGSEFDDNDADDNLETGQNLEVPDILEFWYGGPPSAVPYAYQSHSVLDLDPVGNLGFETHLLTNLFHVPVRFYMAVNDPIGYIRDQHQAVFNVLTNSGGQADFVSMTGSTHSWNTLDETAVCDWLAQHSLQTPTIASTLVHDDGRFFHFDVERESTATFGSLPWAVDAPANSLAIFNTRNIATVTVDMASAGLDPTSNFYLTSSTADGSLDTIRMKGLIYQPSMVLRDGQPASGWVYEPFSGTLTISDFNPSSNAWLVVF